ncbi:MAG TPA: ankyrin repeat domain-containing protein [Thermoanaerobaculia bacterium]
MKPSKLKDAIRAGDLERIRKLIAGGADVAAAFTDGTTPIQLAAREGQVTILRALAAAGADLTDLDTLNFQERLKLFIEASLDSEPGDDLLPTGELSAWAMQAVSERMDDKLAAQIREFEGHVFRAVRTGDLELLKERIAAGDDVNQVCKITRDSPLTRALQKGDEEIVRELLAAGADVDHVGFSTPLSFALPDLRLAKLLIEAEADVYGRGLDRQTPLERAVSRALRPKSSEDSPLLVRFFLEAGVDPASSELAEGTMLMEAEYDRAWEVYQELLPHYSAEVAHETFEELRQSQEMKEYDGGFFQWTFDLRYAVRQGDVEEVRKLLAKYADDPARKAEFAKETGRALKEAIAAMQLAAARVLIDAGAPLDAVDRLETRRGSTPLACAAESWHRQSAEAMRLLLDAGAGVDQRGGFGRTPLTYAVLVAWRHGAALKKAIPLLLAAGADPNLEDEFGLTAWSLARAPLVEAEERARLGDAPEGSAPLFDGPDLTELFSGSANKADERRGRLDRCREALELLEAAGAKPHGEAELGLVVASAAGDARRVEALLASGARADARATDGRPAVVAAVAGGHAEVVARLVAAGCDVDANMPGQPSALELAVGRGDEAMTRRLLDAGANVAMLTVGASKNPLAAAEAAGATEVVALVRGALPPQLANLDRDVEREIAAADLTWESQRALPGHAAMGEIEKVRELLAVDGVEVDGYDVYCRTALMAAAEAGQLAAVRELIARGADVGKCNGVVGSPRSTPLAGAAIGPSAERDAVLRALLEAGADPDQLGADGRTALMHAVERDVGFFGRTGDFALSSRTLIAAGAGLEIRDPYGLTAWMRAMSLASSIELDDVAEQYEKLAQLLEEAGASTDGLPAVELIWAVMVGETERVRELLEAGADPSARRHDGATALILAVRDGNHEIAELLIAAGADLDAREWGDRGWTALAVADEAGERSSFVRLLKQAGASPAGEDRDAPSASPFRSA